MRRGHCLRLEYRHLMIRTHLTHWWPVTSHHITLHKDLKQACLLLVRRLYYNEEESGPHDQGCPPQWSKRMVCVSRLNRWNETNGTNEWKKLRSFRRGTLKRRDGWDGAAHRRKGRRAGPGWMIFMMYISTHPCQQYIKIEVTVGMDACIMKMRHCMARLGFFFIFYSLWGIVPKR